MAEAAAERDLEYILVTDHGPHAPIPSTLDQDPFEEQQADIETVNDDLDITVLQGIDSDYCE